MSENLRTQAGPWSGALTDTSVTIRASVLRSVVQAAVVVAEDEALSSNPRRFAATSMWLDPEREYRHQLASFMPAGLKPDTNYFFRLELDGDLTRALPGRFRTAPAAGAPAGFRFALSGCARPKLLGNANEAYRALAATPDLLFFFHLGDFHYQDIGDEAILRRLDAYDDTLRRDGIGDLFRQLPLAYCWDDHDFLGNNSAGADPGNTAKRGFAREAYDLYVPHYPLAESGNGIYQSFQIGRVLFLLTDCRFNKTKKASASRTVLGPHQKQWLKDELLRGKELDLIVWANSFPWIGAENPSEDFWAAYAAERAELSQHLVDHDIRNVCMISADAHMVAIDDGRNSGYAAGGRGGFPVFHAASLESRESEKGGPYSHGDAGGKPGPGIAGNRQFGLFEVDYSGAVPKVIWTAVRAEKDTAALSELLRFEFPMRRTYGGF